MGFGKWLSEHIAEIILVVILFIMAPMVLIGFLVPADYRLNILIPAVFLLFVLFIIIGILAMMNRLQFMMGLRNLVRHKSDTVIAILGFMIGTSIICSSLAIGDTMGNMIETLVYDAYDLRDEYILVSDEDGSQYLFNGTQATNISDIIWSLNEKEQLIDGVSWELEFRGSVIDLNTELFEPIISFRAFSNETEEAFGPLKKDGVPVEYDLAFNEVFITDETAELIEGKPGDSLLISTQEKQKTFIVKDVIDSDGRSAWGYDNMFFSFEALYDLFNITNVTTEVPGLNGNWSGGFYNLLFISNEGGIIDGGELCPEVVDKLNEEFKVVPHPVDSRKTMEITNDKKTNVDNAVSSMSQFSMLFLTFGTFSIIAGITLIINIFVMLSEERKEEMGISRAVGMKRRHLRMTYLFEGTVYSFISSLVGVALGALTGYGIIFAVEKIIESVADTEFAILEFYTVSPFSLILAFIGGFSITIATTIFITQIIAKLNIVSAIRNTPVPKRRFKLIIWGWKKAKVWDPINRTGDGSSKARFINIIFDKMVVSGSGMLLLGAVLLILGFIFELVWPVFLGASLGIIGIGLVFRFFVSERITYNIIGSLILFIYIVPTPEPVRSFGADMEMFIISGIFMVTAGVLLLIWNTDIILWGIEKFVTAIRLSPATIKMAISYPIKKRFRTGVTIFMFALIIFTITTLSMMVHTFSINIEAFEQTVGGGYDIIGISTTNIDDVEFELTNDPINVSEHIDWDNTLSLTYGTLIMNTTLPSEAGYEDVPMICVGISDKFIETNELSINDISWNLIDPEGTMEHTNRVAWNALKRSSDWVILDIPQNEGGPSEIPIDSMISTQNNISVSSLDGTRYNKTVIGTTKFFGLGAVFLHESFAAQQFNALERKVHLISINENFNPNNATRYLENDLAEFGFYSSVINKTSIGGDYDIIGISTKRGIENLKAILEGVYHPISTTDVSKRIDWGKSVSLTQGALLLNITLPFGLGHTEIQTTCGGISEKFIETNGYGFNDVAWDIIDPDNTMDHTDRNVWNALNTSPDWAIVDSSFGENDFGPPGGATIEAGDNITVLSLNGTSYNKTVIGISKLMGFRSVFLIEPVAKQQFSAEDRTLHLISVKDGEDPRDVANDLRKELIGFGFYAFVVEEVLEEFLEAQNNFFNLFNAFLSLGLIIGIVGLGIVTLRSVYERRHEIGMMRAIGFKRFGVVSAFLGESAFIAGSGLIIGAILGIVLGWILWRDDLNEVFPEFGVPWLKIIAIVGGAFLFALLSSIPPSYKASRVVPAEALRYE